MLSEPRRNTRKLRGGGVGLAFCELQYFGKKLQLQPPRNCEIVGGLITPKLPARIRGHLMFSLYLAPNISRADISRAIEFLTTTFTSLNKIYSPLQYHYCIAGDFNQVKPDLIANCMQGLTSLNNKATRKRSCLDHVLSNFPEQFQLGEVVPPQLFFY